MYSRSPGPTQRASRPGRRGTQGRAVGVDHTLGRTSAAGRKEHDQVIGGSHPSLERADQAVGGGPVGQVAERPEPAQRRRGGVAGARSHRADQAWRGDLEVVQVATVPELPDGDEVRERDRRDLCEQLGGP